MFSNLLSAATVFTYIGYIVIAILILLFMVLIHELGHYIAGKILKFTIVEFSIGFGPKLFQKKKKNGELITLRLFPLGGYCAFDGETDDGSENPGAYFKQKPWKRLIVLFAGAFFNFLSAIVFSFILLMANGYEQVEVKDISNTSINYEVFEKGDVIYGVEGVEFDFVNDRMFNILIEKHISKNYTEYVGDISQETNTIKCNDDKSYYLVEQPITFNVIRDDKKIALNADVNVIYDSEGNVLKDEKGKCSYSLLSSNKEVEGEFEIGNHKYSFGESLVQCVPFTCRWAYKVVLIFGDLITGQLGLDALTGPVGTINLIATQTQANNNFVLLLLPLLAVNLAVFNLLPIPSLDGFNMIFVTIEWIRKKPLKQKVIDILNTAGLITLLLLVVVIDVVQFIIW